MKYASILFTIVIVWIAIIILALIADDTGTVLNLYRLMIAFTLILFVFGFRKRR